METRLSLTTNHNRYVVLSDSVAACSGYELQGSKSKRETSFSPTSGLSKPAAVGNRVLVETGLWSDPV